ncbi:MAG TPA: 1,2-phenylacetyl-CoA epoxidase subunit PaaC [Micromonosporaceae bacterium]|nr:1,2-phenylacetyl-CoA epoxidase subunit PaaC [Micromonosporaceae bacterium]
MTASPGGELVAYLLRLGDDALITAQRLGEWSARAPEMEQDIALSNIALDQLGAARLFLTYAGEVEGAGRDEDALAYLRQDFEFRNAQLVELSDTDFATAIAKLLCLAAFQHPLYEALSSSADQRIAGIAAKAVKESAYHLDHATLWTVRLGDGTSESHRRMADALDEVWPYTFELFESDRVARHVGAAGIGVDPSSLRDGWLDTVTGVLRKATLDVPVTEWRPTGGRAGRHTEALGYLLAEMQVLHRAHPGATW